MVGLFMFLPSIFSTTPLYPISVLSKISIILMFAGIFISSEIISSGITVSVPFSLIKLYANRVTPLS